MIKLFVTILIGALLAISTVPTKAEEFYFQPVYAKFEKEADKKLILELVRLSHVVYETININSGSLDDNRVAMEKTYKHVLTTVQGLPEEYTVSSTLIESPHGTIIELMLSWVDEKLEKPIELQLGFGTNKTLGPQV